MLDNLSPSTSDLPSAYTPTNGSPWLNIRQSADYIQAGPKVIYNAIKAGHLRAARIGGRRDIRIKQAWLDDYLERMAGGR